MRLAGAPAWSLVPGIRSAGTLYNTSEANSIKVLDVTRGIFEQRHIQLREIAITE